MKIADFLIISKCLGLFDTKLEKFNKLSVDTMTTFLAIRFLKTATSGNDQLLHAWALNGTIKESITTGVAPIYKKYYDFFLSTAE